MYHQLLIRLHSFRKISVSEKFIVSIKYECSMYVCVTIMLALARVTTISEDTPG